MSTASPPYVMANGRRSNFTQTCHLLSQFLKDKRTSSPSTSSFSLGINATMDSTNATTTLDLLAKLQNSDEDASLIQNASSAPSFLPNFTEDSSVTQSNLRPSSSLSSHAQMTIFYDGKVLIYDAFPGEKATEIMELATKLVSNNHKSVSNVDKVVPQQTTNTAQQEPQASNMKIPRRASLRKFLEKRKERVIARRPYQMSNPKNKGGSFKGDPEVQSSTRFDLNL